MITKRNLFIVLLFSFLLAIIYFIFSSSNSNAKKGPDPLKDPEFSKSMNLSLKENGGFCYFSMPKDFILAYEGQDKGASIMEFIPQGETLENWTKIITIFRLENLNTPEMFLGNIYEQIKQNPILQDVTFTRIETDYPKEINTAAMEMDYAHNEKRRNEFLVTSAMSQEGGIFINIQCTSSYKDANDPEKEEAQKFCRDFIKNISCSSYSLKKSKN